MNLTTIRTGLFFVTAVLLVVGYAASQWFFFQGKSAEYAKAVDVPSVQYLALFLLGTMVVLWFVPTRDEEEE